MIHRNYDWVMPAEKNRFGVFFVAMVFMFVASVMAVAPVGANNGNGSGNASEKGNSLQAVAEPVDLEEGDVEVMTSDSDASNFDEEFTYYVVRHGVEYDRAVYREPARLGGENFDLTGSDVGSSWFGVSAPRDGTQHKIDHKGLVSLYFIIENDGDLRVSDEDEDVVIDGDVEVKSLQVQFNGKGELLHANGIEPTE